MTHGPAPCTGMVDEALKLPHSKSDDCYLMVPACSAASFLGRL